MLAPVEQPMNLSGYRAWARYCRHCAQATRRDAGKASTPEAAHALVAIADHTEGTARDWDGLADRLAAKGGK